MSECFQFSVPNDFFVITRKVEKKDFTKRALMHPSRAFDTPYHELLIIKLLASVFGKVSLI